jgi:hypothetical protein
MENNQMDKKVEDQKPEPKNNKLSYSFGDEDDVNMIILYRSLYMLKRKFEIYDKEIINVYYKHKELEKMNLVIDTRNFVKVVREIFKECNFSYAEMVKPNDLFKIELLSQINEDKLKVILELFNKFMNENREKYNTILRDKKLKGHYSKNEFNQIKESGMIQSKENPILEENEEKDEQTQSVKLTNIVIDEDNQEININDDQLVDIVQDINQEDQQMKEKEDDVNIHYPEENVFERSNQKKKSRFEHEDLDLKTKIEKEFEEDLKSENVPEKQYTKLDTYSELKQKMEDMDNPPTVKMIQKNYLLIECLPLIIADFIHQFDNIILVEFEDKLRNELRTLFDNEILQRLGESTKKDISEEKEAKLKELLFEKLNIEKNTKIYDDLLVQKISKRENTSYIEKMLQKLKSQKALVENKIKSIQEDNETANNHTVLLENEKSLFINKNTHIPKKKCNLY